MRQRSSRSCIDATYLGGSDLQLIFWTKSYSYLFFTLYTNTNFGFSKPTPEIP